VWGSSTLWNAKCDKNRLILSTGSFPDLLDADAIMGSKYDSENAYSRSGERSRERSRDRSRERSRDRSQDRSRDRSRERSRDRSLEQSQLREDQAPRTFSKCSNLALDVCSHSDFQTCRLKLTSSDFLRLHWTLQKVLQAVVTEGGHPASSERLDELFELCSQALQYAIMLDSVTPEAPFVESLRELLRQMVGSSRLSLPVESEG